MNRTLNTLSCLVIAILLVPCAEAAFANDTSQRLSSNRMRTSQVACTWANRTWSVGGSCSTECDTASCKKNVCKTDG